MRIDSDASSSRGPATNPQEPGQAAPLPEEQAAEPDPEANVAGGSLRNGDLLVLDLCILGLVLIY